MTKTELLNKLQDLLVENWNADKYLSTKIAKGDDVFKSYYKNTLESMLTDEIIADWVQYFEKKLGA